MTNISEIVEEIDNFYRTDFIKGVREFTICSNNRDYLLHACKVLDNSHFGSYKAECSVEVELIDSKKRYKLKIGFDKL